VGGGWEEEEMRWWQMARCIQENGDPKGSGGSNTGIACIRRPRCNPENWAQENLAVVLTLVYNRR
jgi:hypothetical protein